MIDSGDAAWLLTSTALVLFMILPGLALFYAGLVQSRNILSVLMQRTGIACGASLVWMAIEWKRFGKPSLIGVVTGTIAGLATVTPAPGLVGPLGGVLAGLAGGIICYVAGSC